jgi:AraC-like DNA-binding protein
MLKEQGSSFSDLLESVRQSIASDRLRNSNISIIQLADYLGYADNTAFTRAFKRWFGSTPRAWRKSVNSTG